MSKQMKGWVLLGVGLLMAYGIAAKAAGNGDRYMKAVQNSYIDPQRTMRLSSLLDHRALCEKVSWRMVPNDLQRNVVEYQCLIKDLQASYEAKRTAYIAQRRLEIQHRAERDRREMVEELTYLASEIEALKKRLAIEKARLAKEQSVTAAFQRQDLESAEMQRDFFHQNGDIRRLEQKIALASQFSEILQEMSANPPSPEQLYQFLQGSFYQAVQAAQIIHPIDNSDDIFILQYGYSLQIPDYNPANYMMSYDQIIGDLPLWQKMTQYYLAEETPYLLELKQYYLARESANTQSSVDHKMREIESLEGRSAALKQQLRQWDRNLREQLAAIPEEADRRYPAYREMVERLRWVVNDYGEIFFEGGGIFAQLPGQAESKQIFRYGEGSYISYIFHHRAQTDIERYMEKYDLYNLGEIIQSEGTRQGLF